MTAPPATTTDGLYFLANDRVHNWAVAFLESLRVHEPDLRLIMIPFNDQIDAMAQLTGKFGFEILNDPTLPALDEIGKRFFPGKEIPRRTFRKFAVFNGPLERFIFSDVDIVFLNGVREFADAFASAQLDLLHTDEEIHQVYQDKALQREMVEKHGAHGFNTGFWASRRGLFSLEQVKTLAEQALPIAAGFNQGTYEQPFLNYCCDVSGVRYKHFADIIPDLTRDFIAAQRGVKQDNDGAYRIHDPQGSNHGKRITFLHWAGQPANDGMPYRSIFLRYRLRSEPLSRRLWARLRGVPRRIVWSIIQLGRETAFLSRAYKKLVPAELQRRVAGKLRTKH